MGWERKRVGNREGKETTNIYLLSALSLFLTILLWFMVGCGAFDRLRRNLFFRRHRWNSSNFSDHDTQTLTVYLKWSHLWKHRTGGLISAASHSHPFHLVREQMLPHVSVKLRLNCRPCEYLTVHVCITTNSGWPHGSVMRDSVYWLTIELAAGKKWKSEGRTLRSWKGRNEEKEVERVIIEKTKALLSRLWQHPLHQVSPPIPPLPASHPIPSTRGNFLHSSIAHLSLHSSLFAPTNGKNNTQ